MAVPACSGRVYARGWRRITGESSEEEEVRRGFAAVNVDRKRQRRDSLAHPRTRDPLLRKQRYTGHRIEHCTVSTSYHSIWAVNLQ
jgi:hypothetical protein